jgi:hypothetical protein
MRPDQLPESDMKNKNTIHWRKSAVLLAIVLGSPFAVNSAETNISGIGQAEGKPAGTYESVLT